MARFSLRPVLAAALAVSALAGCGTAGFAPMGLGAASELSAQAAKKKASKHGLGAVLKGRPKVRFDEAGGGMGINGEALEGEFSAFGSKSLPAKVDLRAKCPPVYNQGTLGSCTGFAIAKGLGEFVLKKQNRHTELSALALYYLERKEMDTLNEDSGAYISVGMKILDNLGVPAEKAHPYPAPKLWNLPSEMKEAMLAKPDNADIEAGKKYRVAGVKSVTSLRAIRKSVADGLPVVFGISIFDSFYEAKGGVIPVPDLDKEKLQGGHAVTCVGYDTTKQVLIMRNSWGADWGDRGYFYLPYEFVKKGLVMDAWTAKI